MKKLLFSLFIIPVICMGQAPGGVSSNLQMWVKADAGVTTSGSNITAWTDQAGINTFSITGTPQLVTAGLNYNPTVGFNGSSRFSGNTTINNTTHAFAVGKIVNPSGTSGSGALIGNTTQGSGDYFFHTEGGILYAGNPSIYTGYSTSNTLPYNIYSEDLGKTPAANDIIRINGANTANNAGGDPAPYNRAPTLGSRMGENIINGSELTEAILYNTSLSSTDVSRIESYLAVKYGITLNNAAGGAAGDYFASDGTLIWDASDGIAYHRQVIGIGRNDNAALLQKQSQTTDDSTRVYLSTLQATNAANGGSFSGDLQYIMIGNNQDMMFHIYGNNEYPSGQGIYSRINREWKITNTGFTGSFSMDIKPNTSPITASDLRILIDDDGDFSNATMYNPSISFATGVISISGISTAMIPANSTRYLAIVSLSPSTPLPVSLVHFTASVTTNKKVTLAWQTASESNNSYFGIERSAAGAPWMEIGRVQGAGNSSQLLSYIFMDNDPVKGNSYYRLKQTDIDGRFTYSETKPVYIASVGTLKLYPNPAKERLILETGASDLKSLRIMDITGRDMSRYTRVAVVGNSRMELDLQQLPAGIYFIKTQSAAATFIRADP